MKKSNVHGDPRTGLRDFLVEDSLYRPVRKYLLRQKWFDGPLSSAGGTKMKRIIASMAIVLAMTLMTLKGPGPTIKTRQRESLT